MVTELLCLSFSTGNEGNVETYVKFTGFLWEKAEAFGALLVFAEVCPITLSCCAYQEKADDCVMLIAMWWFDVGDHMNSTALSLNTSRHH